ncbi:MAG TPA: HDOD domain-containing protein, partial [Gammaproteobacteria bacterium]|nr:HDOD domain-containing protein [Gammaproteobacteria bacterium]
MAILNLQDLKPGMVLAADAKHHSGRVLLAAGTELTEKHLKVFHTWGLTEADIDGV